MDAPDIDTCEAAPGDTTGLFAGALAAVAAVTAALEARSVPPAELPDAAALYSAVRDVELAAMRSGERFERTAAQMDGELEWYELGDPYSTVDPSWDPVVAVPDRRYPQVVVSAPNAPEANRRAVAWAAHRLGLSAAIPVDGPRQRLRGSGTREVAPGRWHVELEGW